MATQIKKNNAVKTADVKNEEKVDNVVIETNSATENEIKQLREENEQKTNAINDLSKQIATMQELVNKLMASQLDNTKKEEVDKGDVLIGCRFINGAAMATNDNRLVCRFDCDEEKYVPVEDFKRYLNEANRNLRNLFEIDGFYFVDPKDYDKFNIRKRLDLSHEKIKEIVFTKSLTDMIDKVNLLTNNKNDFNALHLFQYEICKMLVDPSSPLAGWDYANRIHLEDYIGIKFDELLARLSARSLAAKNRK